MVGILLDETLKRVGREMAAAALGVEPRLLDVIVHSAVHDQGYDGIGDINDPGRPLGPTGDFEPMQAGIVQYFNDTGWHTRRI
jgi:hypothetical protein